MNIVCIFLDDTKVATLDKPGVPSMGVMPYLESRPQGQWTRLLGLRLDNPTCGPSRATMSTGQHSRRHGSSTNQKTATTWESGIDPAVKWPAILAANGVKCGFWGKYENGYPWQTRPGNQGPDWIPPGFEAVNGHRWHAFTNAAFQDSTGIGNGYLNYSLNIDGAGVDSDGLDTSYSTDVIFADALNWIGAKLLAEDPFVAFLSLYAPHDEAGDAPAVWHPRHDGLWVADETYRTSNHNALMADAPAFVAGEFSALSEPLVAELDEANRAAWRATRAVDEGIEDLIDLLVAEGALSDTVILFLGDNSNMSGQHAKRRKGRPFEESLTAYGMIRWPGAVERDDLTACGNHDWVPTLEDVFGVTMPHAPDGMSLRHVALGEPWRDYTLAAFEWDASDPKGFTAVGDNDGGKLVRFYNGSEFYVDLQADPVEMQNLTGDSSYAGRIADAREAMARMLAVQPRHPTYPGD